MQLCSWRLYRAVKKLIRADAAFVDVGFEKDAFPSYTDLSPSESLLKFTQQAINDNHPAEWILVHFRSNRKS
jgi:hypothetical protein